MSKDKPNKDKLIIENFARIFNKIRRVNESNLNELDYNDLYHKMQDVGDQSEKVGGIPRFINRNYIDNWVKNAQDNLGKSEDYTQDYLNKVLMVKKAFLKQENGDPLTDQEKKILRFIDTNKFGQANRIAGGAYQKLLQQYLQNFQSPLQNLVGQTFEGTIYKYPEREGGETQKIPTPIKLVDAGQLENMKGHGFSMTFGVIANKYKMRFTIYSDGSMGFFTPDGKHVRGMGFSVSRDSELFKSAMQVIQKAKEEVTQKKG